MRYFPNILTHHEYKRVCIGLSSYEISYKYCTNQEGLDNLLYIYAMDQRNQMFKTNLYIATKSVKTDANPKHHFTSVLRHKLFAFCATP